MRFYWALFVASSCLASGSGAQGIELPAGPAQDGQELQLPRVLPRCPPGGEGEDGEIVICARPREEARYRLPRQSWTPNGPVASVSRERHMLYEQGDVGIGSCSNVGPGGWTGCAHRAWKAAREQHGR